MIRIAAAVAVSLVATTGPMAMAIDANIAAFIHADGFEQADAYGMEQDLSPLWFDVDSVSPGGQVGPLEKGRDPGFCGDRLEPHPHCCYLWANSSWSRTVRPWRLAMSKCATTILGRLSMRRL